MKWSECSVPEAIQLCKKLKAVFLVYISGNDEQSSIMDKTWLDEEVAAACERVNIIAIKITANSELSNQFAQIYPVVMVPIVYFIGTNGRPLDVVAGSQLPSEFIQRITNVQQRHNEQLLQEEQASSSVKSSSNNDLQSQSQLQSSGANNLDRNVEKSGNIDGDEQLGEQMTTTEEVDAELSNMESSDSSSLTMNDRLKIAQKMREERKRQKDHIKKEEEKQKELERRQLGKEMTKFKEWAEEKSRQDTQKEWKKDKAEERLYKEKIKEQIERDREEKASRFKKLQSDQEASKAAAKKLKLEEQNEAAKQEEIARRAISRLQFRMPDGSTITQQFSSSDTLNSVHVFVSQNVSKIRGGFVMSTLFPKRTFTSDDMSLTLLDLQLVPSASIIILPSADDSRKEASSSLSVFGLLSLLLAYLVQILSFIYRYLFAWLFVSNPSVNSSQSQSRDIRRTDVSPQEDAAATASSSKPSTQRLRPPSSYGVRHRQDGNIRRFTADEDSDSENATWNGNSTQQM